MWKMVCVEKRKARGSGRITRGKAGTRYDLTYYYSFIGVVPVCSICGRSKGILLTNEDGTFICEHCVNFFAMNMPFVKVKDFIKMVSEIKAKFHMYVGGKFCG